MCDLGNIFRPVADFFGDIGTSIGTFATRAFTPPGTGGLDAIAAQNAAAAGQQRQDAATTATLLQQQNQIAADNLTFAREVQAETTARADEAIAAQTQANRDAIAASVPVVDRDSTRIAADRRLRKLLTAGAFGARGGKKLLGQAPLGYRNVTGA